MTNSLTKANIWSFDRWHEEWEQGGRDPWIVCFPFYCLSLNANQYYYIKLLEMLPFECRSITYMNTMIVNILLVKTHAFFSQ